MSRNGLPRLIRGHQREAFAESATEDRSAAARLASDFGRSAPSAILCSAQHWTAPIHLSAHHLAEFLVKRGWRVCFLSTPTSLLHGARNFSDAMNRARLASWRRGGAWDCDGRLFHYTPLAIVPPSRLPPLNHRWLFANWPRLSVPRISKVLSRHGFGTPDLMILDSALMAPVWREFGCPRLIYRITDRNQDFPAAPAPLHDMERELARAAAVVTVTGSRLASYAEVLKPRATLCISNGVDLAHMTTP